MNIGSGQEATFRDGCLSLRAATIAKLRESPSPGFSGHVPNGIGKQPLSNFRSEPEVGWGHYTQGLKDVGRPVEMMSGKGTPGPQYQLDRLTCGRQVQSRFKTAPTPVFGSSQRQPLNDEGTVSPGPMTATMDTKSQPPGPAYSMAGAPWRNDKQTEDKSPGPGQYSMYGSLGEQKESTRVSFKGCGFGGSGVAREMTLPSRNVPGPGHYAWHENNQSVQPGMKFGSAPQRPSQRPQTQPGPCQYQIPSTMGTLADSRFRTVVAPGFGTPPPLERPRSAGSRLGTGPGPGAYDVQKMDDISVARRPLSKDKSCKSFCMRPPTHTGKPSAASREVRRQELDPECLRRAVKLTRKGCRVPDVSFGVAPQRPVESHEKCPGPQAYDPENIRRAVAASRSSPTKGVTFGTGPQRYNGCESGNSPGPNAAYVVPSTMGTQANSAFKSVNASSFGAPPKKSSRGVAPKNGPGPSDYHPTMSNRTQTTRGITFGGATSNSRASGAPRGTRRRSSSPGPGAYSIGSGMGRQTTSRYKSGPAPSFRAR